MLLPQDDVVHNVISMTMKCAETDNEVLQLGVVRALLTFSTAEHFVAHGEILLAAVRTVFNLALSSDQPDMKRTACNALLQMLNTICKRVTSYQFRASDYSRRASDASDLMSPGGSSVGFGSARGQLSPYHRATSERAGDAVPTTLRLGGGSFKGVQHPGSAAAGAAGGLGPNGTQGSLELLSHGSGGGAASVDGTPVSGRVVHSQLAAPALQHSIAAEQQQQRRRPDSAAPQPAAEAGCDRAAMLMSLAEQHNLRGLQEALEHPQDSGDEDEDRYNAKSSAGDLVTMPHAATATTHAPGPQGAFSADVDRHASAESADGASEAASGDAASDAPLLTSSGAQLSPLPSPSSHVVGR